MECANEGRFAAAPTQVKVLSGIGKTDIILTINVLKEGVAKIHIYTLKGVLAAAFNEKVRPGMNTLSVNRKAGFSLIKGTYFIRITVGEEAAVERTFLML